MSFNEYLNDLRALLKTHYPLIDIDDFGVANKIEELAWILNERTFNPRQNEPEKRPETEAKREGWRQV